MRSRRRIVAAVAVLSGLLVPAPGAFALPARDADWPSAAPRTEGLGNTPAHTTPAAAPVELPPRDAEEAVTSGAGEPGLLVLVGGGTALVALVVGAALVLRHGRPLTITRTGGTR